MASATKTSRRTKNIFDSDSKNKAVAGNYYNRATGGQLKITGAYKFLGLDKEGNYKPSKESNENPGFLYSPSLRVAGTPQQLLQYALELQAAAGAKQIFAGGANAYVNAVVSEPTNYTASSVSVSGPRRAAFVAEVDMVANASKSSGSSAKMSANDASRTIDELLDFRKKGITFELRTSASEKKPKAKAKAKPKKKAAAKKKRTGKPKAKVESVAESKISVASPVSPVALGGMPSAVVSPGSMAMGLASPSGLLSGLPPAGSLTTAGNVM